ncbi:MAG: hypothetical protein KDA61_15005 [Planctomycetales bacterium]|nr:hypothetical protein [Planctomycetales bacterium]
MNARFTFTVSTLALALLVSGCGSDDPAGDADTGIDTTEDTSGDTTGDDVALDLGGDDTPDPDAADDVSTDTPAPDTGEDTGGEDTGGEDTGTDTPLPSRCDADADCNDGLACTTDACVAGACAWTIADDACFVRGVCYDTGDADPGDACSVCDPATNQAQFTPAEAGATCDDGNICTADDVCLAGVCTGEAVTCNDGNACTDDVCDPSLGCTFPSVADGTTCDDTSACTENDRCEDGTCVADPVVCDDGDPCTTNSCNPDTGCVETLNAAVCEDGDACTTGDVCADGTCTSGGPTNWHLVFAVSAAQGTAEPWHVGGYSLTVVLEGMNEVSVDEIERVSSAAFRNVPTEELVKLFDPREDDFYNDDGHADDALNGATQLETVEGFVEGARFSVIGAISDVIDVDSYRFTTPVQLPGFNATTIAVRSLEAGGLAPKIQLFDDRRDPVEAVVLANGSGQVIVQAIGLEPEAEFSVQISAADAAGQFATGNYELTIGAGNAASSLQTMTSATLGDDPGADGLYHATQTFGVARTQLFYFLLDVARAPTTSPTVVSVVVRDADDAVVYRLAARPGEIRSNTAVLLEPGEYTVEATVFTLDGQMHPLISYELRGAAISDPFVGDPTDPTASPFACSDPEFVGMFCYPGDYPPTFDPYLWGDFVDGLPQPTPEVPLPELVSLLLGDWWSWVWAQAGAAGPPLGLPDVVHVPTVNAQLPQALAPGESVLTNDVDPQNGSLAAVLSTPPTHGVIELSLDGTFTYVPDLGFAGRDEFSYVASSFLAASQPVFVSIVVGNSGDFTADGRTDGFDFLTWQRGFGQFSGATLTEGDGTLDGRVDALDVSQWESQFGAAAENAAAVATVQSAEVQSATVQSAEVQSAAVQSAASPRSFFVPLPRDAWISPQADPAPQERIALAASDPTSSVAVVSSPQSSAPPANAAARNVPSRRVRLAAVDRAFGETPASGDLWNELL